MGKQGGFMSQSAFSLKLRRHPNSVLKGIYLRNQSMRSVLLHLVAITVSLAVADLLQFDFELPREEFSVFWRALLVALPIKMLAFGLIRLHQRRCWQMVDWVDLNRLLIGNASGSLVFVLLNERLVGPDFPWSIYFIDFLMCFV